MKNSIITLGLCSLLTATSQGANIVFEDFEDATLTYTSSVADDLSDISSEDYYGRIDGTSGLPGAISYSNPQGTGFYGASDTDGSTVPATTIVLSWSGVDVSGFTDLGFSVFLAEDDDGSNEDWDSTSSLKVEYQIDGGGFQNLLAFESSAATNTAPFEDTDFDGTGDGTEMTDAFTQFSKSIAGTGSILDLRITIDGLNAGDEDVALDNVTLTGTAVPEPSSFALLGLAGLATMLRRRR